MKGEWIEDIIENPDRQWWQIWKPKYIKIFNTGKKEFLISHLV